jgi:signal transduction histidine kinase
MVSADDGHVASLPATPTSPSTVAALAGFLPDGLVVIGADRSIRYVNREAERILECRAESLVERPVHEALPLADKYGRDWWEHTKPWAVPSNRSRHREVLLVGPDGRDLLVTARYVRDAATGHVERVLIGLRDAEARLRAERDQATVLSTVAHELRAPLTSVTGFTSSLLRRWERFTDEQKRLMIETIESDANRLTRLITELLDISRLDSDNLTLRLVPVDMHQLLGAHVTRHELSRTRGQVVLRLGGAAKERGLPEVWADSDRLEQVFFNLIENALRHGEAPVTVTLDRVDGVGAVGPRGATGSTGAAVQVLVDDHGNGIPEEDRQKVFGRFWHGADGATTGLGLYVVRGLVEAHGGTVTVGTGPAGGARFEVRLPGGVPEAVALP